MSKRTSKYQTRKSNGKISKPNVKCNELIEIHSDVSNELSATWKDKKSFLSDDGSIQLNHFPFTHCIIKNLFVDTDFVSKLQNSLLELSFIEKSNDLYQFHQSSDLNKSKTESIQFLREFFYDQLREWIQKVTDIQLNSTMDMSCAIYKHTDVLLCHDDELEGRRIAYILYLVPEDWNVDDGGLLDLYSINGLRDPLSISTVFLPHPDPTEQNPCTAKHVYNSQLQEAEFEEPDKIVKSLTPLCNSLVFFEVTPISFHQVSEILSKSKDRLSISGWFHGEPIKRPSPFNQSIRYFPSLQMEDEELLKWVNPIYLDTEAVESIQKEFETNSEAQLNDFLLAEKYDEVLQEIRSPSLVWEHQGPANKRSFSTADCSNNSILKSLVSFLTSKPMFKLLTKLTGLELADLDGDSKSDDDDTITNESSSTSEGTPTCSSSVRRWQHGNYTLAHDFDASRMENALDSVLYFNCDEWNPEHGGFTTYIVSGEDEELLTVEPLSNCLSLVYRDKETLQFVKFINNQINDIEENGKKIFYDVACCYKE